MARRTGQIINPESLTAKERGCIIKLSYASRVEAKRAAKQKRGFGDNLRSYKCKYCTQYHLTTVR